MHAIPIPDFDVDRATRGCFIMLTILGAALFVLGVVIGNVAK